MRATWAAPGDDGGARPLRYIVRVEPGAVVHSVDGEKHEAVVDGLSNGLAHTVSVTAVNRVGEGPACGAVSGIVPLAPPSPPKVISAMPADSAVHVAWEAPKDNGGAAVEAYVVQAAPAEGSASPVSERVAATLDTPRQKVELRGILNGTPYVVSVKAENSVGLSEPGCYAGSVTPVGPSAPPQRVRATGAGDGWVTLEWSRPDDTGGSPIEAWLIEATEGKGVSRRVDASECPGGARIDSLENGTAYRFTVAAVTAAGDGTPSDRLSEPATPFGDCSAPRVLNVKEGDGELGVSWSEPESTGGAQVVTYDVRAVPAGQDADESGNTTVVSVSGDVREATVAGLTNGTAYCVSVCAHTSIGGRVTSAELGPAVPVGPCSAAREVSCVGGHGSIRVEWESPRDSGGVRVTAYEIEARMVGSESRGAAAADEQGAEAAASSTSVDGYARVAEIHGLRNGLLYDVHVVAVTRVGRAPAAKSEKPILTGCIPTAPLAPSADPLVSSCILAFQLAHTTLQLTTFAF